MNKLFAVYIGGAVERSHIELHDIRFCVAEKIEDTYEQLRNEWWGLPDSLHIDCWAEVTNANGYKVTLKSEPSDNTHQLYFVNLGGYEPGDFAEAHKNVFVVGETESKAKIKAIKMVLEWKAFHRDYMYEVEKAFCLNDLLAEKALYVHLEPIEDQSQPSFTCHYRALNKRK